MKKILILTLVLGITSYASAAPTIFSDQNLLEPPLLGTPFNITISGLSSDAPLSAGLYPSNFGPEGIPVGITVLPAAGNLGTANILPQYGGFDFVVDDLLGVGVQDGDWVIATYIGGPVLHQLDFYDYSVSYETPVYSFPVYLVPEPMTLSLLALGGLLIGKSKKNFRNYVL